MNKNRDKLYELAFRYRKTRLWQKVYEDMPFGVQLEDGEIAYCVVMGRMGQHIAIAAYVGDSGYQSYRFLYDHNSDDLNEIELGMMISCQNCLQCSFENKDMLEDDELYEVKNYTAEHNMTLRGKNAFPRFVKYMPGRYPWFYDAEQDIQRMTTVLSAALAVAQMLEEKKEIGFTYIDEDPDNIPLLTQKKGRWEVNTVALPNKEMALPHPLYENELQAARIRKARKKGELVCGSMRLPEPVLDDFDDCAPYYPFVLASVDPVSGLVITPIITMELEPEEIITKFADTIATGLSFVPKIIYARDDLCATLLEDFCRETDIQLSRDGDFEELEEAMENMIASADDESDDEDVGRQVEELMMLVDALPDADLRSMPEELVELFRHLADEDILQDHLVHRLQKALGRRWE